jgi:putative ABC transport system substrate-binding protein
LHVPVEQAHDGAKNFMKRRALLVGGAASAALAATRALAQQPGRSYRIGVLIPMVKDAGEKYLLVLRDQLARHGFVEGRNLRIDAQFVAYGTRPNLEAARELVALKPDAIFACSTLIAQAAKAATSSIPIVFAWVADPVVSGIVSDYARPGGAVTGVSNRFFELAAKRLDLVRELLPGAKRVVVMSGVFDSVLEAAMVFAEQAAKKLGFELVRVATQCPLDSPTCRGAWGEAMRDTAKSGANAVLVVTPFAILGWSDLAREVVRQSITHRLPAIYSETETVGLGGLMSYATNLSGDLRRGADLLARVLRGQRPAELPVDQAARFELAINLKTARAIGLTIPQSLLVRADRVIE